MCILWRPLQFVIIIIIIIIIIISDLITYRTKNQNILPLLNWPCLTFYHLQLKQNQIVANSSYNNNYAVSQKQDKEFLKPDNIWLSCDQE